MPTTLPQTSPENQTSPAVHAPAINATPKTPPDNAIATAERDERPESAAQSTADAAPVEKSRRSLPSLASKSAAHVRRHSRFLAAAASCLALGFGLGWLNFKTPPAATEVENGKALAAAPKQEIIFASTARRNEPLLPLVPFTLDTKVVELGRRLFHDPALSGNGRLSCASCHIVDEGGDDNRPLSVGPEGQLSLFNAPTVLNAAYNYAQFWDGRAATLEEQIDGPLTDPAEMGSSWERVTKYLQSDGPYDRQFKQLLGGEATPERVRTAIATYERSLVTVDSKFDQWLKGSEEALSADEFGGYYLFKKYNCVACHQGLGVGGNMFQRLGSMKRYFTNADSDPTSLGRFRHTGLERDRHVFRVPQLRNIELTAPYFHDGSVASLDQAVAIMLEYQCGEVVNPEDVRRIVAFLKTLTGKLGKPIPSA